MTDAQIRKKLEQIAELCNELDDEAKRRWGAEGNLFFEADGSFHMMTGDCVGNSAERQAYIKFSSNGYCRLGAGAW